MVHILFGAVLASIFLVSALTNTTATVLSVFRVGTCKNPRERECFGKAGTLCTVLTCEDGWAVKIRGNVPADFYRLRRMV